MIPLRKPFEKEGAVYLVTLTVRSKILGVQIADFRAERGKYSERNYPRSADAKYPRIRREKEHGIFGKFTIGRTF